MLAPNSTLQNGRYEIIRHLGGGGQGNVYEGHDTRLNNRVAIKEALGNDPTSQQIFEKEAQRLDRLRHSALPTVKDHFIEGQGQYLVMEFIAGQDLAQMLKGRAQPFPVEEVLAWGEQLLDALAYLHRRGVIHRDIKPANLKLTPEREIILLDFGLAKGGLTIKSQSVKGYTPGFAPPEQMSGQATDKRSDLYSLGATLYALLTNTTPADPFSRLYAQSQGQPDALRPANELNPQVPPHIADMLTRAMALEPNERPTSAKEMSALLSPKLVKPQPTLRPWALGAVAAVLLVVIVVGFAIMSGGDGEEGASIATSEPLATEVAVAPALEPSPTPLFPLLAGTPLPQSLAVISDKNASELRQLARWGKGKLGKEVAYSSDGKLLAASSSIGIYLHDAETLQKVRFLENQEWINTMALSPDGMLLAANGPQNSIQLWQVSDGQLLRTLEGHTGRVNSLNFSPDGQRLASGGCLETDGFSCMGGEVRVWQLSNGQLLTTLQGHTDWVTSVSFSPSGEILASASSDSTVRLWRVSDGQLLTTLEGHTGVVNSVNFSPDGLRLASGSYDSTVRLWQANDGQLLHILEGHTNGVTSISFSSDGERLASASDQEQEVRLWRVSDGQLLSTLEGLTNGVTSISFSSDGERLASASYDSRVRVWRLSDGQLLHILEGHTYSVESVSFSPNGEQLASAFASNVSGSNDHTVRVARVSDGQLLHILEGHTGEVTSVSFSPNGELLASASWDSTVRLWRVSDGQLLAILQGHTSYVTNVSFSPNGQLLASASWDSTVRLWQVSDGQLLATLEGHTRDVTSVSFSPDGQRLASGSQDLTVRLWRVSDGQLLATLEGHTDGVTSVSFSPDGKWLASGTGRLRTDSISFDDTVLLWRVSDGQLLHILEGHTAIVTSVSFSPDSERLTSASFDGTVRLWRVSDGQLLAILEGHADWVTSVSFSSDGRLLVSSSRDGTIRLWGVVE